MTRDHASSGKIGPYRLLGLLASGGAGQIHIAVRDDEGAPRRYALKTILPSRADSESTALALRNEAILGTQLLHPNIVGVHDYGRDGDIFYVVMDYVDGADLSQMLERARNAKLLIPDILSAWIMSEVCEGLGFAHRLSDPTGRPLKLVHRDITPHNILVGKTGEVRITDFGVAHFDQDDRPDTEAGVIKGKLRYLAPEYLETNAQDHRGDIFTAGLVLYELLTRRPAYPREDSLEVTLQRLARGAIQPIREYRPDLRDEMERILEKALSPDPERRYHNADDMAGDLKRYIWHTSSGLTRARVGELLGSLGLFGDDWEPPRAYEESMHAATGVTPNPVWEDRRLDDTTPIRADLIEIPEPNTAQIPEPSTVQLPESDVQSESVDRTQRVSMPPDAFDPT